MEIQQLKHLIAAVQHGNLLKAAEASNITQSGLSRSISTLEHRLGVPLLNRSTKGVEPTAYGRSVIQRAHVILNEVNRSIDEVRAIEQGRTGTVSLGITQNYALYLVPGLLTALHAERPLLRFRVVTGGFMELIGMVRAGEVDLMFGLLGRAEDAGELSVTLLRDHYSRVIARAGHPLLAQPEVSLHDLSAACWAALIGEGFQRGFANFFEMRGFRVPNQALQTDSIHLIRRFVLGSDALTVLPPNVVNDEIDEGTLAILPCDTPAEATQLALIQRAGCLVTPQVQLVVDRITQSVAAL